jgi:cytochrome P450
MHDSQPTPFEYDPFSREAMENPLPLYKVLRRHRPIYYSSKYDSFFFTRFDDIVQLLSLVDNELIESEGSLPTPQYLKSRRNTGALAFPPLDPFPMAQQLGMPVLGEIRRAHTKPLRPNAVKALTERVRRLANERLDLLLPRRRFDLVSEFGGIVSSSVMMDLMGMPLELAERSLKIVNSGTRTDPDLGGVDTRAVANEAIEFYTPFVQARADAGADGGVPMVDGLFEYRINGRPLTVPEIARQLVCAFIGGIETVPKVTAHGLMELNTRPSQMQAVRADLAANVPAAAEEMLRFCAPAQWFMRTVRKPISVCGQEIRPGQRVFAVYASALRDEHEFDEPDEFRWNRPIPRVLSFGHGPHFCIGAHLARMEIRVMVEEFLRRVERFQFDTERSVRHPSSFQWGWNHLQVVIE